MRERIKIKKNIFQKHLLVKYFIAPILFAAIIYSLGYLTNYLLSLFIPFFKAREYIFIFIFFTIFLNSWSKRRWNKEDLWINLGFTKLSDNISSPIFKKELCKSFLVIACWSLLLIFKGYLRLKTNINYTFLFDILFTAIFVGVAEELLFRVWLFEELNLFLSKQNAIIFQSLVFSLVHPYNLDENLFINILIKIGLFLLGSYLNLLRINNYPNVFPSIAFHGGIVGFMFLAKSIFEIEGSYSFLIYGVQYDNFINPVSGLIGILTLLILNFYQFKASRKIFFNYD